MKRLLIAVTLAAAVAFAGGISGQVVDATTGEPIAEALVVAKSPNGDAGRARTNDRGAYRIGDLRPGAYNVTATARGYLGARYPRPVPVRANQMTEDINFRLAKKRPDRGAISGRVVNRRTGAPVKGAVVAATDGRFRLRTRSDARGRYLLRGLKPGKYKVIADARGYAREVYPRPVPVIAGEVTKDIDFALTPKPRLGAITGRVVDARTREPIAGALVVARGGNGGRALTDRRGVYTIRLHPGAYRVVARARGYTPKTYPHLVRVRPGRVTKDINLELRPNQAIHSD
jgi:protocatechuate 3,4-dioxygenase beta subunit